MSARFARAVLAFLILPGTVAFLVPVVLLPDVPLWPPADALGLVPFGVGVVLLLWCVREFYVAGKGTLAPWSPPEHLVVSGLYRFTRNPMYLAVLLVIWGWALGFRSVVIAVYAVAITIAFHLRVVLAEEPWLARTFTGEWNSYKSRVPRWLGSRRMHE